MVLYGERDKGAGLLGIWPHCICGGEADAVNAGAQLASPSDPRRREVSSLAARWHQEEGAVQEALRLLGGLGGRLDGFLGQWERAQREQAQSARGLQELRGRADELCTM